MAKKQEKKKTMPTQENLYGPEFKGFLAFV